MNDTRWSLTSFLLFLGGAFLVGGSLACAAAAPAVLRDLTIVDVRHFLMDLAQGAILLSAASVCMISALVCALVLDGGRTPPTIRAPQAWNTLWQIRWNPLDARTFNHGLHTQEHILPASLREAVHAHVPVTFGGGEAVAMAMCEREPAFATPTLRHARVKG